MIGLFAALQVSPLRRATRWLPAPGSGPTPEQRARGFVVRLFARSERDLELRGEIDRRDPGYGSTAVMSSPHSACARSVAAAGVSTPAAALKRCAAARLRAAMTWQVEPGAE